MALAGPAVLEARGGTSASPDTYTYDGAIAGTGAPGVWLAAQIHSYDGAEALLEEKAISAARTLAAKGSVDLYRAVGVREFNSVIDSGKFVPGANSLEGRQFATTMEEALAYADRDPSKVTILKATIDRSALGSLDFSRDIDPFIFKNGVYTVQPGAQSDIFHAALQAIGHVL